MHAYGKAVTALGRTLRDSLNETSHKVYKMTTGDDHTSGAVSAMFSHALAQQNADALSQAPRLLSWLARGQSARRASSGESKARSSSQHSRKEGSTWLGLG